MDQIALFVDDADHARTLLRALLQGARPPALVVLVACPPRLTRRIGKWVCHRNREQWRANWSQRLFGELAPEFNGRASTRRVTQIGHAPLAAMAVQLRKTFGIDLSLFDARRPKLGQVLEPIDAGVPAAPGNPLAAPFAVTSGICVMLALVD